jgi:hypothetical protein
LIPVLDSNPTYIYTISGGSQGNLKKKTENIFGWSFWLAVSRPRKRKRGKEGRGDYRGEGCSGGVGDSLSVLQGIVGDNNTVLQD